MKYYFVGIKGSGMSSLAKILLSLNEEVRGCDYLETFYTENGLENIKIDNLNNYLLSKEYIYIIGNAFVNHEIVTAIKNNYQYYTYPEFIKNYFQKYIFIAISGSHGKTQTTKLLAHILDHSIGLIGDGSFKVDDNPKYFLLEACEYKNTFLNYNPDISLILNVDYDHVDFFKTEEDYQLAFINFMKKSKICIINSTDCKINYQDAITYSKKDFKYQNGIININNQDFKLPFKGEKFAENFMGIYKILKLLNVDDNLIKEKLKTYKGAKRRYEIKIEDSQIIISDYAHHPNEIKTMYEALKEEYKDKKLVVIFEPHTITRLEKFIKEYKNVLSLFDETYLYKLFTSVREIYNVDKVNYLYDYLTYKVYNTSIKNKLKKEKNIVIAFLGAGNIDKEFQNY